MPSRYLRVVLPTFVILALAVAPSVASAQTQDQSASPVAAPAVNLLSNISFLPAVLPTTDDAAQGAPPQAQYTNRAHSEGFGVGAKVGPLFASLSGCNPSCSNRTGLIGGLWFGGNRGGTVGVMGEILYAKKGAKQNNFTSDLYYLEIPILLRVNIGKESANGARVYILAGPVADILLKGQQNGIDVKSNYQSLDLGVKFGVGFEILRLLIEAQENIGLRNTLSSTNSAYINTIHTRTFAIMVGVRFN